MKLLNCINNFEARNFSQDRARPFLINFVVKVVSKITYYATLPTYNVPDVNLQKETQLARTQVKALNYKAKDNSTLDNELEKIFLKVTLRYSPAQQKLHENLISQVYEKNQNSLGLQKYRFVSPFLPVLHLSDDNIEKIEIEDNGSFHSDRDSQFGVWGSKVIWLPFTDYEYEGVVSKNLFVRLMCHYLGSRIGFWLLRKFKNTQIKSHHIGGHWIVWTDVFQHGGLQNNTPTNAIALILRFSNKYSEQTFIPVENILDSSFSEFTKESYDYQQLAINEINVFMRSWLLGIVNTETRFEQCRDTLQEFLDQSIQKYNQELKDSTSHFILHLIKYIHAAFHLRISAFATILEQSCPSEASRREVLEKSQKIENWLNKL